MEGVSNKFRAEFVAGRVPIRYTPGYDHVRHSSALEYLLDLHEAIEIYEASPLSRDRRFKAVSRKDGDD